MTILKASPRNPLPLKFSASGSADIKAAEAGEGGVPGPSRFDVEGYTGGTLVIAGFDLPVVLDLESTQLHRHINANLDHDSAKRVGHVDATTNDKKTLRFEGVASAATAYRDEVVNSAKDGYQWEASIEASPGKLETVGRNKTITVNGQQFQGPIYVARGYTITAFAFVSHGADAGNTVNIAAQAAFKEESTMDPKFESWLVARNFTPAELDEKQLVPLQAAYTAEITPPVVKAMTGEEVLAQAHAKREREQKIANITAVALAEHPDQLEVIEAMHRNAITTDRDPKDYELDVLRASRPQTGMFRPRSSNGPALNNKVLEAAICMAGNLEDHEKMFDDQTLQAARDRFKGRIGLQQVFHIAAEANGHHNGYSREVTIETQRAAFGMLGPQSIKAAGFSTLSLPNVLSTTANKFLREGWMYVDMTPLAIATVRPVTDFKEITTVSLTGDLMFDKIGPDGEIKHGTLGELTYGNKADTYARMLAITRQDIINDDLGALTSVPRRLGRGAALKLNDIFWTAFLNNSTFFSSGNANVSTSTGTLTTAGLAAAETIFLNQTDPDGKPLGTQPAVLLVPTALKTTALQLMESEKVKGSTDGPDGNPWRGRFRVESSPYMSNSSYTGYSAAAWYMLADKNDLPVIEIAALYGRVEPNVETADADFNVLGVQMRGYSDVGVRLQEYRGGVRADGD